MGLSILNNIPSLEAQNQLATTNMNLQNTLFQLSSGSKINSGADDPAGLSIADGLQANISALTQSAQNVTDGVGMLQTADGALSQVTTLLNRAVTLATEAGNAGLTTDQQNALQNEYASITAEINQIGSNTTYNNNQVFTSQLTSVFLSDGSQTDSADPTISVTIPTLSAQSLGLSSYAQGTLDLTTNPQSGDTVQIGQQVYTFENSGSANAANEVALGTNVQGTLQNLKDAVNGTGTASPGTYGVGTGINQSAQIVSMNGGSAVVQALHAGTAGDNVQLITNLTSSNGISGAAMSGGTNVVNDHGTLTLNAQPGVSGTASATLTMSSVPDTLTAATGTINLAPMVSGSPTPFQPTAGNSMGSISLGAGNVATPANLNNKTVTINGDKYKFVSAAVANAGEVEIDAASIANTMTHLEEAVNGGPGAGAGNDYVALAAPTGGYSISSFDSTTGVFNIAATALTAGGNGSAGDGLVISTTATGGSAVNTTGGAASDTITVGSQTYTFVAANAAVAGNEIALGATENQTLLNLADAVNGGGTGGSASTYSAAATAAGTATILVNGNSATVTATTPGTGGNATPFSAIGSLVTNEGVSSQGALSGGLDADTIQIGTQTYTFVAANNDTAINDVVVGNTGNKANDIQRTLENLMGAVNGTATDASGNTLAAGGSTWNATTVANTKALLTNINNGMVTVQSAAAGAGAAGADTGNYLTLTATSAQNMFSVSAVSGGSNPDTVTIGNVTYTFVAAGQANANDANNEVALGAAVVNAQGVITKTAQQATLDNLMAAVNSTSAANGTPSTYHLIDNTQLQSATAGATITSDANGVAQVQALGTNGTALTVNFAAGDTTGAVGGPTASTLSGGVGTSVAATGMIDLAGGQPTVGNATGTVTFGANLANYDGQSVTIGGHTYTFKNTTNFNAATAYQVLASGSVAASLQNLEAAVNGVASANVGAGTASAANGGTGAAISSIDTSNGIATFSSIQTGSSAAPTLAVGGGAIRSGATLTGGGTSDTLTLGAVTYTFVAANTATAGNNDVALGTASGSGATAISAVQQTLLNLQAAVNAANDNTGTNGAATYQLASNNTTGTTAAIQVGSSTGVTIAPGSVNGDQAVVTSLFIGAGTAAAANGNFTVIQGTFANASNVAGSPGGSAAAQYATGQVDLTGNPLNGNTITIGNTTYTFVNTAPTAAYEVAIGATPDGTLTNLQEAVDNGATGTGAGTNYGTGTVANALAQINPATGVSGNQATVTATTAGVGTAGTGGLSGTGNYLTLSASLSTGVGGGVVGTTSNNLSGGGAGVDLQSSADAQTALTVIAGAISTVAATRGAIGSSINQMNAAVQVMNNTSQNLTSSLSGIQDADIGKVVANMSKYQVLEQTGIAALAQANQNEQVVLKLIP